MRGDSGLGYRRRVRWDDLFDDLEAQLDQELRAGGDERAREAERLRIARLGLRERLDAMGTRTELDLVLHDASSVRLRLGSLGRDWLAGEVSAEGTETPDRGLIVPFAAIAAIRVDRDSVLDRSLVHRETPAASLAPRIGLGFVLRDLARRRRGVDVQTRAGRWHGTIDRVGTDHLDLAVHERSVPRRRSEVREIRLVPFAGLLTVLL